jgi:hypothetical protein
MGHPAGRHARLHAGSARNQVRRAPRRMGTRVCSARAARPSAPWIDQGRRARPEPAVIGRHGARQTCASSVGRCSGGSMVGSEDRGSTGVCRAPHGVDTRRARYGYGRLRLCRSQPQRTSARGYVTGRAGRVRLDRSDRADASSAEVGPRTANWGGRGDAFDQNQQNCQWS